MKRKVKKGAKKPKKRSALNGEIDGKFTVTKKIISDNAPQITKPPKKSKKTDDDYSDDDYSDDGQDQL